MTFEVGKEIRQALKTAREVFLENGVEHCLIGALAPKILLAGAHRTTLDADIAVLVLSWDHYEEIRTALLEKGFTADRNMRYRLHLGNMHMDLLPYSPALLEGENLVWCPVLPGAL
jgi:predicted nucleotidyltransferase